MLFWLCAALVAAWLLYERTLLLKNRKAVPLRIHVYGTRGKTGLTRRVIALLRQNGIRTMGRTTGDEAILHNPEGTERPQRRLGPANIHEYLGCLNKAAASGCKALVMECMALAPENVHAAGNILQPGHVLLTNTRPDHYESQGPADEDIMQTLSLSMAPESRVYALADAGAAVLEARAARNGNSLVLLEERVGELSPERQSICLANCLAEGLGLTLLKSPVSPALADRPGAAFIRMCHPRVGTFWFLDLFSANDVVSAAQLLKSALVAFERERFGRGPGGAGPPGLPLAALLATRADRPLRTRAFADWLAEESVFSLCCPVGGHALYATARLHSRQMKTVPGVHFSPGPENLLRMIGESLRDSGRPKAGGGFLLAGLGNMHGYGERFRAFTAKEMEWF